MLDYASNNKLDIVSPCLDMFGTSESINYSHRFNPVAFRKENHFEAGSLINFKVFSDLSFDEEMKKGYEDWEFFINCYLKQYKIGTIGVRTLCYRKRPESMLTNSQSSHDQIMEYLKTKHIDFFSISNVMLEVDKIPIGIVINKNQFFSINMNYELKVIEQNNINKIFFSNDCRLLIYVDDENIFKINKNKVYIDLKNVVDDKAYFCKENKNLYYLFSDVSDNIKKYKKLLYLINNSKHIFFIELLSKLNPKDYSFSDNTRLKSSYGRSNIIDCFESVYFEKFPYPAIIKDSNKKQIIFVLPYLSYGGVEKVTLHFSSSLNSKFYQVYILILNEHENDKFLINQFKDSINFIKFNWGEFEWGNTKYYQTPIGQRSFKNHHLYNLLSRFDIIFICHALPVYQIISDLKRINKTIIDYQHVIDEDISGMKKGYPFISLAYEQKIDYVITCSESLLKTLNGHGFPIKKLLSLQNTSTLKIDINNFTKIRKKVT